MTNVNNTKLIFLSSDFLHMQTFSQILSQDIHRNFASAEVLNSTRPTSRYANHTSCHRSGLCWHQPAMDFFVALLLHFPSSTALLSSWLALRSYCSSSTTLSAVRFCFNIILFLVTSLFIVTALKCGGNGQHTQAMCWEGYCFFHCGVPVENRCKPLFWVRRCRGSHELTSFWHNCQDVLHSSSFWSVKVGIHFCICSKRYRWVLVINRQ